MIQLDSKQLVFIGDLHGSFETLVQLIKPFTDTCFIVCGDCGFGFADTKYAKIQKMIKANFDAGLEKRNNYLLFFRGNHDDPSYFEAPIKDYINTHRFRLMEDFTIVEVARERVMCIGGAVSVDRRFRKVNSSYWFDEEISFKNYDLHRYVKETEVPITILATHSAPRKYVMAYVKKEDWVRISFDVDKKLVLDCDREDKVLENMYKNYPAPKWIHGHYHFSGVRPIEHGELISLNINELYPIKSKDYYDELQIS